MHGKPQGDTSTLLCHPLTLHPGRQGLLGPVLTQLFQGTTLSLPAAEKGNRRNSKAEMARPKGVREAYTLGAGREGCLSPAVSGARAASRGRACSLLTHTATLNPPCYASTLSAFKVGILWGGRVEYGESPVFHAGSPRTKHKVQTSTQCKHLAIEKGLALPQSCLIWLQFLLKVRPRPGHSNCHLAQHAGQ